MGKFDKQLKYSIRKVSVGAASVVIGAFYLAMGAGVVHAETNATTDGGASHSSPSPDLETSRPNGLTSSNYGAEPARNPGVSGKPTESTTPKEKENNETLNAAQPTEASTSANTRGRRSKRDVGNPPADGTSNTSTGTETAAGSSTGNNEALNSALTERKGATVQANQPGINIPKGNENGADDPNAHLSFNDPDHTVTVEEMWKIIQNMPDDFQNNERSYLRNMDTLGNDLRFDKTETNPEGVPLQPGEIREINSFGGWHAINKEGHAGKFAVGKKNDQGYFTGWYKDENGNRQEGGMLGSDALDRIYLHEQALDRRFKYMLMLAKGRTIANKDDKAQDGSTFDIVTANSAENKANLASLPVKDREDILQHAPNIEGFNGIEKTFTAFSTAYGSRLKIEFVTGYISDFEGSKGTYRIVVKAIKKDNSEETVYDHTINRIDGVVENEERYSQGVDLSGVNGVLKKILKGEYDKKVNTLADAKYKEKYPSDRRKDREKLEPLKEEAKQELVKKGDVIYELPFDKDELREDTGKRRGKFKEDLKIEASSYAKVANDLNNVLKRMNDAEVKRNSPIWDTSSEKTLENPNLEKSKDPDRVFKLLDFVLPTAKKIIYHADTDQLELQTDPEKVTKHREELKNRLAAKEAELNTANEEKKIELKKEISALKSAIGSTNAYTYTEARNGSKEAKILGSFMKDKTKPDSTEIPDAEYGKYHTNELAEKESDGLAKFTRYFVEKNNVTRSNVLADDKLSEKITTAIEGDQDKLGKGGYFSTGDIPLGKDVVSYKVQVFAENEKRVGVNKQSPRLQYNLPILADFSVIQDTVEPSKELARRIISKSNLPEDKKKEIIEKINKSKKTSEIRSQLSGDVKVKYQDVSGKVLTLDNTKEHQKETDLGKKGEDGTYLAVDSGLRYTNYNVTDKKLNTITTSDGKQYILKRSLEDGTLDNGRLKTSADESGTLSDSLATVTFVYEEYTPPATGKGLVHFKKQVTDTTTEALTGYDDITLSGNVGETFSSTEVDTKITELKNAGYEIVRNEFDTNSKTIDSTADVDGQDPSQVYNVVVRERITTDTETKPVTRTIKYVKIDDSTGEEVEVENAQPTNTTTVNFTRNQTMNLVTGLTTNGKWSENQTLGEVKTPVLEGYVADKATVEAAEVTGESQDIEEKVVYRKIGSWVPRLPEGVTPPTGTDMTPKPYPNNPDDPTKPTDPVYPEPGTPTDPNTPKPPVIPYVPGYTPKTPNGNPLVPVDPEHPEKGYKVPPVPTKPGENTPITYEADPQKVVVKVFNTTTGTEVELPAEKVSIENGTPNTAIPTKSLEDKIKDLEKRGYTVDNKDLLKGKNFDTNKDVDGQDPSQVYKLLVRERTTTDTETKPVTRTIKYVKIDDSTGEEVEVENAQPTNTTTVNFTRNQTMNLVTGLTTNGKWSENQTLGEVKTPVLEGYVADKATVEAAEVTGESQDIEEKVVYRKIGSWVPRLPEGVTPPTGTDMTPKPYPNNPDDPTKPTDPVYPEPGTPTDPNTPKPPVIPYVPGYTPKTPNGNPLVPVDPEHPEKGYKVPPVPTKPGENTPITYVKDGQQKATTSFVDPKGNVLETPITETGDSNTPLTKDGEIKATIAKLKLKGYDVETNTYPPKGSTFDNDPKVDQYFKVTLTPRVKPVKPFDPTDPKDPNKPVPGQPIDPDTPVDPNNPNDPTIPRWTDELIKKLDVKKEVTRTINYVDEAGNKVSEPSTDKVTFTREAKINVVTGEITYGDWKAVGGDSTFDKVPSPVVKGYILKDPAQKEVAERKGITPTVANQTIEVVYKKLGSWVPKVPGVETPTPLPYPNNPTDPTKPGDPTDPTTPNVPVIPYVPGYTPKTPDGNPLVPVDPNHPENGYKVPPVPTKPGEDTPIEYVKVPNTPSPEEPVKPTPESNHITIWVDENGKPLKPEKPGTHEPGNIPGYRYITTVTKDGVTIHKFEKITPVDPNNPVPQKPTTPIPTPQDSTIPTPESQIPTPNTPEANTPTSETNRREELPNTGTEANASLASAGIMTLLAGLGLGFFKKKEEDESE